MPKQDYAADRAWSDRFSGQIRSLIEQFAGSLLKPIDASFHEDANEATDYRIVATASGRVAVRVRRWSQGYRDLTIRSWRAGGRPTEHHKLLSSDSDLFAYLYCWADAQGEIAEYIVVDLAALRQSGLMERYKAEREKVNKDGKTAFYHITKDELAKAKVLLAHNSKAEKTEGERLDDISQRYAAAIYRYRDYCRTLASHPGSVRGPGS